MNASGGQDPEFNTNLRDKEERKAVRRNRIEQRHAITESNGGENQDNTQGAQKSGLQQISESLFHLDKKKTDGIYNVTSIRVISDETESRRRVEDEKMRHERLSKLQHEALASAKANAAIEMKWAELLEKEIPQELHQDIQSQMASCAAIIRSKDNLITEFLMQLRGKDEEYVRSLRQQAEDIEQLLTRIRKEFATMQAEYDQELDSIEDVYLEERDKLIQDHTTEIDSLFENRRNREVHYKEAKQKREEQYHREIESLITKGADQYNKLKIELEMNIQTLKQQLEEIRATYQLNTEKLDYNYRVLTELDVEKNAELSRYKRRLTRLKDQLNQFSTKFNTMNSSDSKINNDLTEDYRRLTQKYKDLQAKFRHFEVSDTQKFDEVWAMHEDEARDLVDKLLKADKVITEQQLGWKWKAPDMLSFNNTRNPIMGGIVPAVAGAGENSLDGEGQDGTGQTVSGTRIRLVLKMLASEAGFLSLQQSDVVESLDNIPSKDIKLSQAEAMLRALGVKNEEKVLALIQYFFKDSTHGYILDQEKKKEELLEQEAEAEMKVEDEEGNVVPGPQLSEEEQMEELRLQYPNEDMSELIEMISPESLMAAMRSFMDDTAGDDLGSASRLKATDDGNGNRRKLNNIYQYWSQLADVVSDDTIAVWNQLEKDALNYKDILAKRAATVAEVDSLVAQNTELKRLLNQYLGDRSNDNFCIPPSQTMRVRKQEKPKKNGKILMSKTG
jgi:dynein regulatory complex protein 1